MKRKKQVEYILSYLFTYFNDAWLVHVSDWMRFIINEYNQYLWSSGNYCCRFVFSILSLDVFILYMLSVHFFIPVFNDLSTSSFPLGIMPAPFVSWPLACWSLEADEITIFGGVYPLKTWFCWDGASFIFPKNNPTETGKLWEDSVLCGVRWV